MIECAKDSGHHYRSIHLIAEFRRNFETKRCRTAGLPRLDNLHSSLAKIIGIGFRRHAGLLPNQHGESELQLFGNPSPIQISKKML
jgi:hypothetical protein